MANLVKVGRGARQKQVRGRNSGAHANGVVPTRPQLTYLQHGLGQPAGKLPLFDENGQAFNQRTIQACIDNGWAEPWFANPQKPDWQVCKLTEKGFAVLSDGATDASADVPDG